MLYDPFTHEWAVAYGEEIRANQVFAEVARGWISPLALLMTEGEESRAAESRAVYLDLFAGECRDVRVASAADLEAAHFILAADLATWRRLLAGEIDIFPSLMSGRIKLAKGRIGGLLPHFAAAKQLVVSAARVPTRYPDEE